MSVESDFQAYSHNSYFTHDFFVTSNPTPKHLDEFFWTIWIQKVHLIINLNSTDFYPHILKEKAIFIDDIEITISSQKNLDYGVVTVFEIFNQETLEKIQI